MAASLDNDEETSLLAPSRTVDENRPVYGKSSERTRALQGLRLYLIIAFPYLGLLLVAMDVTIVSTLSATMASDFSSLAIVSWLGSAYLVASAAIQPLCGKLTDIYGRRSGFFSVNCIIAFIVTDLVPLDQRTVWSGLADVVWAVGIGLGGVAGGFVNDWVGWRWAFLGLAPLTFVSGLGTYLTLTIPRHDIRPGGGHDEGKESEKIDYLGAATLTSAVVSLTIGFNLAGDGSVIATACLLPISIVFAICFVFVERSPSTTHPIMPLALITDRSIGSACVASFLVAASMHSLLYYVPFLIQVRGSSASEVGIQMLGELVGASVGSMAIGIFIKVVAGYALIKPFVFALYLLAPLGFMLSDLNTPIPITVATLVAMGAGFGSVLTVLLIACLALTERSVRATATSMLYAFRQTGAACGLGVAGFITRVLVRGHHDDTGAGGGTVDLPNVAELCDPRRYPDSDRPDICVAYGDALHQVFLFTTVLAAAAMLCSFAIRSVPLRRDEDQEDECGEAAH
ncbi:major facilitator superfamily domain-containing protein [Xylariaceae sp. FL0804]|nr:major facilitator superfamily domain-containing protein [Xylariaceae sp. FL0804]